MKYWWMSKEDKKGVSVKYIFVAVLLGSLTFLSSCQKDSGVGSNVLPANDLLNAYVSDTSTVISSLKLKDSVISTSTSLFLLGSYNDPVFGMTKGSLYTQVVPPGDFTGYTFGPGCVLDSVVLAMPFNIGGTSVYGNLTPQTFIVDTIMSGGDLVLGHTYYSDTNVLHSVNHVGMATITPNPITSLAIWGYPTVQDTNYSGPELRIKLNNSYGQYLLNENTASPFSYASLRGLYITTANQVQLPGQGAILYLDPFAAGAGLIFYYKSGSPLTPQYPQIFQFGSSCASIGHFDHNYSSTSFYAGGKDSVVSPNVAYVEAMAGVKTQLSFPFLSNWKHVGGHSILINMALVEIPVNVSATGSDIPPPQAYLVADSNGKEITLPDEAIATYGGTYDATNHWYVFNIARYIQQVLDGKIIDKGLYLVAGGEAISANGAVLYGASKNNPNRIRLKLYYSPLNH